MHLLHAAPEHVWSVSGEQFMHENGVTECIHGPKAAANFVVTLVTQKMEEIDVAEESSLPSNRNKHVNILT